MITEDLEVRDTLDLPVTLVWSYSVSKGQIRSKLHQPFDCVIAKKCDSHKNSKCTWNIYLNKCWKTWTFYVNREPKWWHGCLCYLITCELKGTSKSVDIRASTFSTLSQCKCVMWEFEKRLLWELCGVKPGFAVHRPHSSDLQIRTQLCNNTFFRSAFIANKIGLF